MEIWLWVLAIVLIVAGIVGTVMPALPGPVLVFAGLLVAAWADGFEKVGWLPLTLIGALTAATYAIDFLASVMGAKKVEASKLALFTSALGMIAGIFFGLPGMLLGPFIGTFVGEYIAKQDLRQAGKVGLAAWLGMVIGSALKLAIVFGMVGVFVLAYLI